MPRVAGQLQLHGPITQDLIEFGYEQDDQWLHALEGADPDLQGSHWPEFDHPNRRAQNRYGIRNRYMICKEAVKILIRRSGLRKHTR